MDIDSIIVSSAAPIVVTDEGWRVIVLNKAAEELLGYKSAAVRGRFCHELICGRDAYGNRFCHAQCTVGTMAARGEPIRYFEMDVVKADGGTIRQGFLVLVFNGPRLGERRLLHVMTPCLDAARQEASPAAKADAPHRTSNLTTRETAVLRLLAQGKKPQDIASSMGISLATVRNHVQNVLRKLEVHSQLEAVAVARLEELR